MAGTMYSFRANDGVTLKYIDTGAEDAKAREKPWLILVSAVPRLSLLNRSMKHTSRAHIK